MKAKKPLVDIKIVKHYRDRHGLLCFLMGYLVDEKASIVWEEYLRLCDLLGI